MGVLQCWKFSHLTSLGKIPEIRNSDNLQRDPQRVQTNVGLTKGGVLSNNCSALCLMLQPTKPAQVGRGQPMERLDHVRELCGTAACDEQ